MMRRGVQVVANAVTENRLPVTRVPSAQKRESIGANPPKPTFRHVISLGFFCGAAQEIERYGLRDGSYPLDWVICGIDQTLGLLEADFDGFLRIENLARDVEFPYVVRDGSWGIDLYHDFAVDVSIGEQHEAVAAKYLRRIERFRAAVREPTLFVRYVANLDEHQYLNENLDRLRSLIKGWNTESQLVLVANRGIPDHCGSEPVYLVRPDAGDTVARQFLKRNRALTMKFLLIRYPIAARLRNYRRYRRSKRARGDQ